MKCNTVFVTGAEVTRVYVCSFSNDYVIKDDLATVFNKDRDTLMNEIDNLAGKSSMRKLDEMTKRIRRLIIQICVLGALRAKMPYFWGKEKAQLNLIKNLEETFGEVRQSYQLSIGDFPNTNEFQQSLMLCDFTKFPIADKKVLNQLQDIISVELPIITSRVYDKVDSIANENQAPPIFNFSTQQEKYDNSITRIKFIAVPIIISILAVVISLIFKYPDYFAQFAI